MKPSRLILFLPSTLLGFLYAIFYRDPFEHVAIEHKGQLYDSDWRRGSFDRVSIDLDSRAHIAIEFDGDVTDWLVSQLGRKHRWSGFWGWLFRAPKKRGIYTFEMAWLALQSARVVAGEIPQRCTGLALLFAVIEYDKKMNAGSPVRAINQILSLIDFPDAGKIAQKICGPSGVAVSNAVVNAILNGTGRKTLAESILVVSASAPRRRAVRSNLHRLSGFLSRN